MRGFNERLLCSSSFENFCVRSVERTHRFHFSIVFDLIIFSKKNFSRTATCAAKLLCSDYF
jgi:hypothetical protein